MNYTYMVKCADGTLYTGWTNCVEKRLKAHNEGKAGAKYTRAKRPVELVYYEGYATKEEAMSRWRSTVKIPGSQVYAFLQNGTALFSVRCHRIKSGNQAALRKSP